MLPVPRSWILLSNILFARNLCFGQTQRTNKQPLRLPILLCGAGPLALEATKLQTWYCYWLRYTFTSAEPTVADGRRLYFILLQELPLLSIVNPVILGSQ
jgi:hypothetical protein